MPPPPSSLPPFSSPARPSPPSPLPLVPRPFTSLSSPSTLVHRPREPPAAVLRFTLARFRTLGGWLSKLSFETCTFVALTRSARASGPYILTIFSERCEHGGGLFAQVGIRFLGRTSGRSRPARNPSTGKPTLDGAVTLGSRSVLSLPHPLTRFSLFRESAESYFMSRELRRACSVN